MEAESLQQIETLLGYSFKNQKLLIEAMSHSSQTDDRLDSNERLEFLGDAVLSLVVCTALFERFPDNFEGDLTKMKSLIVSRKMCSDIAIDIKLADFIQVGKGTDRARALIGSIAAGTLEAVIAAVYLDGGFEAAQKMVLALFAKAFAQVDQNGHHDNFKSMLQQFCQRKMHTTPHYELLDEKGPDHNKCFEVAAVIQHRRYPSAWSMTKKEAEQKAAYNALIELRQLKKEESSEE